jgi:hypothetical protein
MYWLDKYRFPGSIEYEYKYPGKYGAKGEKREKREKATPEQIKLQNQRNREKRYRRLIKANFRENDYWITLKYPKGVRKQIEKVKEDLRAFLERLRKKYKKMGEILKFIRRIEIGCRGGVHIHMIANRFLGADIAIKECWEQGGVHFALLYEQGGFKDLAEYITKPANEKDEEKETAAVSSSRNLIRPEPEREYRKRWTVRKIIENGVKPTEGYYIDEDTVVSGLNKYTGMSYLQYTEYRIAKQEGEKGKCTKSTCT